MSARWKRLALGVLAALAAGSALAGPMGFKESWMAMGDFGPNWREAFINYAPTARDAVGVSSVYMRSDDKTQSRLLNEATYTRLLKRWNAPHSQANLWFIGGLGSVSGNDYAGTRTMATPGLQVDYETTRVYVSATARLYRAEGLRHDYASARAGFSFFEVDYDQIQPWFILEARRMAGLSEETEITPMLRLIHKRYFVELGVNTMSQARFNFMYIF